MPAELPSFEQPPVSETVLGVQFPRLDGFKNAHLGLFWQSLGEAWANATVRDAPPLSPVFERFPAGARWGDHLKLQFSADPAGRMQIVNDGRGRMVQVQNGRLHYNWIGSGEHYPRYKIIRPEFEAVFRAFQEFLAGRSWGDLAPDLWEITYVNHIPRDTVWEGPADWHKLFVGLPGPFPEQKLLEFESFGGHWHYEIPRQRGRLHVEVQHGSTREGEEALVMTLTARGALPEAERNLEGVLAGLDLGHETIVLAFKSLTSPEAHEYWRVVP